MSVDLQKIQEAANLARRNFLDTIKLNNNTHRHLLIPYVNGFLDSPVKRPDEVRRCAECSRQRLLGFDKQFTIIVEKWLS
jgi:hypothetical protein